MVPINKVSLDTNILIDEPGVVFQTDREFVISFTVIRELDHLKRNPDLKRSAQQAIKNIWCQYKAGKIEILNLPTTLGESPDERILQDTKVAGASILSNDIAVRLIAKAHGVAISDFEAESDIDYNYTGYVTIKGDATYEKKFVPVKEMQLEEFNTQFNVDLKENQYCIIDRISTKDDIWVNHNGTVSRISQSRTPYGNVGIVLTPLDNVQACALHAVFDHTVPLTIIDGALGTGKTILSLMAALATTNSTGRDKHYDKILVTKPPVSTNRALYTGFKPGTSADKMSGHLSGFKSNLKFLLDPRETKPKKLKVGEEPQEKPSDEAWMNLFEIVEIDEMQGFSIHHKILLVDEWQLLDEDGALLVLSRISEGAKVVLIGDTQGQTYGMNRANEGFKVIYKHLGTAPEFNFIKLDKIYRSKLAEFVATIFK